MGGGSLSKGGRVWMGDWVWVGDPSRREVGYSWGILLAGR